MDILMAIGLLLMCLGVFTFFTLKMPKGREAMSGLALAAIASFLVEAVHYFISYELFGIQFLGDLGEISGSMSGVAAASLVALRMGVNPGYAVLAGLTCGGLGILPGFLGGYVVGIVMPYIEKKVIGGIDLLIAIIFIGPVTRLIAMGVEPSVNSLLGVIGEILTVASAQSPIIMGIVLGGIAALVGTSPLSSMALTAMLGLTGGPMAIAGLGILTVSFTNGWLFHKLDLGNRGDIIAVMIEPLTQADKVTANPIPIYSTNFIAGGIAGIVVALIGLINNAPGTASAIPAVLVLFGWNDPVLVVVTVFICAAIGLLIGIAGAKYFSNHKRVLDDSVEKELKAE